MADVDFVMCTHLHIDHTGQAELVEGFPQVGRIHFADPHAGPQPRALLCAHPARGLEAIVLGDLAHHKLQCREPGWSTPFCWDPEKAAQSRMKLFGEAAESDALLLPIHFPSPTARRVRAEGERCHFHFYQT